MGERSAETTLTTLRDVRDDHHVHHCEVEGPHDQNHTITASGGCHQLPVQVVDPNQVVLHNTQLLPLLVVVIITEICKSPTLWLKVNKCGQKGSLSIFFFSCMTCAMFTINVSCHHTHRFIPNRCQCSGVVLTWKSKYLNTVSHISLFSPL